MQDAQAAELGEWLGQVRAVLESRGLEVAEIRAEGGVVGIHVALAPNRPITLDCSQMPSGFMPRFDFLAEARQHEVYEVEVANLAAHDTVAFGRVGPWGFLAGLVVTLAETAHGTVVISRENISGRPLDIAFEKGCRGSVRASNEGTLRVQGEVPDTVSVFLSGGVLVLGDSWSIPRLTLTSTGTISTSPTTSASVEVLSVEASATALHFDGVTDAVREIAGPGSAAKHLLSISSTDDALVDLQSLHDLRFAANSKTMVRVMATATEVSILGPTHLHFASGCTASRLICEEQGARVPHLSGDRGAVVTGVCGPLELGEAAGLQLEGDPNDLLDLRGAPASRTSTAFPDWTDLTIQNFTTPGGLHGRAVLAGLATASFIDPDTTDLPGWRDRLKRGAVKERYRGKKVQLRQDLEYVRALNHLCREAGSPGSTRTKVGWAVYRLRQDLSSAPERGLLAVYRLVGYGERPLPAFCLWMAAALSMGLLVHVRTTHGWWDPEPRAIDEWCHEVIRQAIGPLGATFRLEVQGDGPLPAWLVALKILVVVPLATGLLALRNFVKER